ncbi:MAG: hypothetical protein L3J87_03790, partial [Thermoplasmata archaeon]|nr:hypothetical protein [Thermoplasmata archaeon]
MIRGTPLGREANEWLARSEELLTPAVVLAEVALQCRRDGLQESQVGLLLGSIAEASRIVP